MVIKDVEDAGLKSFPKSPMSWAKMNSFKEGRSLEQALRPAARSETLSSSQQTALIRSSSERIVFIMCSTQTFLCMKSYNMDYELAKKLKEAGFPDDKCSQGYYQDPISSDPPFIASDDYVQDRGYLKKIGSVPTLSELIEACVPDKSDDMGIKTDTGRWHCWYDYDGYFEHNERFKNSRDNGLFSVHLNVYGGSPEEAVANLWLELNKK